jgi:hypothetical protein
MRKITTIISIILLLVLTSFCVLGISTADIYLRVYTGSSTVTDKTCSNYPSFQDCSIEELTHKNLCWAKNGMLGGIPGRYYIESEITYEKECEDITDISCVEETIVAPSTFDADVTTEVCEDIDKNECPDGATTTLEVGPTYTGVECLDSGEECTEDKECVPLKGYIEGHCVQGNAAGDKFCRPTEPWCGDNYCDDINLETCADATRLTDVRSCPNDPICKQYICVNGCSLQNLAEGDYSSYTSYPSGSWSCNEDLHCDGLGDCVSDCRDEDGDGYGLQPSSLFNPRSCSAISPSIDCNDEDKNIYPGSDSSYCDCDHDTGKGITQGTEEGSIDLSKNLNQDLCFDKEDNDCDTLIDCQDPGCSPEGYIYPIEQRICYGDCSPLYQTNENTDRACCPNPSDCVIDGRCAQSGDSEGSFPSKNLCYNGQWYGGDTYEQACSFITEDSNYDPYNFSHWNLPGNAGENLCCGDDEGEYYTLDYITQSSELAACCSKPSMFVIEGECIETLTKRETWDQKEIGYCLTESQCLVNPNSTEFKATSKNAIDIVNPYNNEIRCINNEEFIGDHYCNNGEWTTRTALIATHLLPIVRSLDEASLFCSNYNDVLNYYKYNVKGNYAENYFGIQSFQCKINDISVPCTNNLCILKYKEDNKEKIIIGASLNNDINSASYSILESFEKSKTNCNNKLESEQFELCTTGVLYNNKIKSVMFGKELTKMNNALVGTFISTIRTYFASLANEINSFNPSSYDYSFILDTQNFNKIYINKKDGKTIIGITEEIKDEKYMAYAYYGFTSKVCEAITNYININPKLVPLDCIERSGNTYILTGGTSIGYYDLLDDLGPKLRIN